jgi:DHA2 family multidrug resistance protein-like MFS transporter
LDQSLKTALNHRDATPDDGLPKPRRYFAILTIWLAIAMSVLDGAIANVALPTIARDLGATAGASIWVVNAYQLAITVALLPLASLGDKIGYHRVYLAGLTVFTVGSIGCALSGGLPTLVAARIFQGLGAAGIMSINTALLRLTYPSRMLGRGIGLNAVVVAVAAVVGPTLASAILAVASWPWLFAVNVPVGALAIAVAAKALPRSTGSRAQLDFISAGLNALAFGGVILGLESLAREGPGPALAKLALGLVAGILLVRRQLPLKAPLLPLDLMRIPIFRLSVLTSVISFAAQMLAFVALPFFFQGALHRSAVETGLLMTPWPLAVGLAAPIAGRLADRYPAGLLGGAGLAVFSIGLALLSGLGPQHDMLDVAWRMIVCGLGFGLFQSPNNRAMVASSPRERSGAAGGMLATARLLGQTLGTVVMAVLFQLGMAHPTTIALAVAAALAAVGAIVSLLRLRLASAPAPPAVEASPD